MSFVTFESDVIQKPLLLLLWTFLLLVKWLRNKSNILFLMPSGHRIFDSVWQWSLMSPHTARERQLGPWGKLWVCKWLFESGNTVVTYIWAGFWQRFSVSAQIYKKAKQTNKKKTCPWITVCGNIKAFIHALCRIPPLLSPPCEHLRKPTC